MTRLTSGLLRLVPLLAVLGAVNAYVDILALRDQQIDVTQVSAAYDYVVVGGGQSGLVIATRLSENTQRSVLVVEYGYFEDNPAQLDPASGKAYASRLMFNATTVPQPGLNNRTASVYAASVVGGGSAINGMLLDRGSAEDYDNWERLGNPGWGWSDLLPYFKKSTTFTPPGAELAREYNITWDSAAAYGKGPIQVTYPDWQWPTIKVQWKAWKEIGVPIQKEGAAGDAYGAFWVPSVVDQQYRRSYSRNAYYDPASSRKNLNLLTGYRVNKILFNSQKRATAVTIQPRGSAEGSPVLTIKAAQEVIVCAGWLKTPQLLQRSGVGPKALLDKADVKVVVDLPGVGSNLQDHPPSRATFDYQTDLLPDPAYLTNNATFQVWAAELWKSRKGPYSMGVGNALATLSLPLINPNYQATLAKIRAQNAATFLPKTYSSVQVEGFKAQRSLLLSTFSKRDNGVIEIPFSGGGGTSLCLEKPLSRGTVLLNTTDLYGEPIVDYNSNINPVDQDIFVTSLRFFRKWMAAPSMQQLTPVESAPGANVTTDQQLLDYVASSTGTSTAHSCGTASLAPRNLAGVVSPQLLVYGVSGLSVGDISIIPMIPATHTCATVYAIAEKAADLIKARYSPFIPPAPTRPLASSSTALTIDEA